MRKKRKTLIEATPNWLTSGIFANLAAWAPWNEEETATTTALNLLYYGDRSGDKPISPLIERLMGTNETLGSNDLSQLSGALRAKYGLSWAKLWDSLYFEYNPIENYSMTEHEEIERSDSANNSKQGTSGNTRTDNLLSTRTDNLSSSVTSSNQGTSSGTNSVYGVNSSVATPSDEQEATTSGSASGSTTNTGTQSVANTGTQTDAGSMSESGSETREGTEERNHTRSGNIGVTTAQQMIESERQLWMWNYFDQIFADIDKLFASPVY